MRLQKLRGFIRKIKILSPRASVIASTIALIITKPIGYLRLVLIAYFFGAAAGMDAYYIASGAVSLIMGLAVSIVQNAVVPNLMRLSSKDDAAARSFFAYVARFVLGWGGAVALVLIIFPSQCIWLLAPALDNERASIARNMLLLILPMGYVQLLSALLNIWANYRKMYSLINIVNAFASPAGLLILLILVPFIGVYAVALSLSIVSVIFSAITLYLLRDIPLFPEISIPGDVLRKTAKDAVMCIGILGAGTFYTVADRWFAAGLEAGNVSAISYSSQIVSLMMMLVGLTSQMHLAHSSRISEDAELLKESLNKSLAIGWAYMLPIACAAVALSFPIVKLVFGYGAFDERAISLTAPCFAILAVVTPLSVWSVIMGNFGLATSRLKLILTVSYISVCLNVFLDWLFAPIWGAAGLCAATSLNQGTIGVYYIYRMAPAGTFARQMPSVIKQVIFSSVWALVLFYISDNMFLSIIMGVVMVTLHLFACEYFGWLEPVPESWRPRALLEMVLVRIRRVIK
ncbi:MAG: polysaccharide biosynthesis C-terminal domain-containing protein [Synergistaceae bacterium]|nr:polysaccharide biosynthesis C-terminal domain-containing protein [Synergistaceae bacterium]